MTTPMETTVTPQILGVVVVNRRGTWISATKDNIHMDEQNARYQGYPIYWLRYHAEDVPFEILEAHVELGGIGVALREKEVYGVFKDQDVPFKSLYDVVGYVTWHIGVSLEEIHI